MAYNIQYDPKALKQLKKLDQSIAATILEGIEQYSLNPSQTKIKKLKTTFDGAYRLRVGDYRVVFYQEGELIFISKTVHRKDVYL